MGNSTSGASNAPTQNQSRFVKVGEAAEILGVSESTVRNYVANGTLTRNVGPGGHRKILRSDLKRLLNPDERIETEKYVICYSRVSQKIQDKKNKEGESQLTRQKERLATYAKENYPNAKVIHFSEQSSAGNPNRKQFNAMMIEILNRKYDGGILLTEHYDRISRHFRNILQLICDTFSIEFVAVEHNEMSDIDLLMQDFSALFFLYQVKTYGNRAGERLRKEPTLEGLQRGRELAIAGMTVEKAVATLKAEGFENISAWTYRKYILHTDETGMLAEERDNSAEKWIKLYIQQGDKGDRLLYCRMWEHYTSFCQKNGLEQLTKRKFYANFRGYKAQNVNPNRVPAGTPTLSLFGLKIRGENLHINVATRKIEKMTTDLDIFFKFYDKYRGQVLTQHELQIHYRKTCKEQGAETMGRFQLFTACERYGARKVIKSNKLHWELR